MECLDGKPITYSARTAHRNGELINKKDDASSSNGLAKFLRRDPRLCDDDSPVPAGFYCYIGHMLHNVIVTMNFVRIAEFLECRWSTDQDIWCTHISRYLIKCAHQSTKLVGHQIEHDGDLVLF